MITTKDGKAQLVKESVDEIKERNKRKLNVILYNVPESRADDVEERKGHDMEEAKDIMKELGVEKEVTINKPIRLAKSKMPQHADKPRPLRVTVNTEEERKSIMRAIKNMEEGKKSKMKTVFIIRDMTPLERIERSESLKAKLDKDKQASERKSTPIQPGPAKGKEDIKEK